MMQVETAALMASSGVKFGTSGARGLVTDMSDLVCYAYTLAFLSYLEEQCVISKGVEVAVAGDYRASSPRIMAAVGLAIKQAGFEPVSCGFVPTPALALYAIKRGIVGIMVTGSHIPDDRNGIKFYKPEGEILKADELGMCSRLVSVDSLLFDEKGFLLESFVWKKETTEAYAEFVRRYVDFFPKNCLKGKRIGVYEHSSVARELLCETMKELGAEVFALGRSDTFIPVDTEAVREEDVLLAKQWSAEYDLDCIVSADGDGDRPLVSDENGVWLRGDVAGIICASFLAADVVVVPVSCNSAVEKSGLFEAVARTKIGSPFVIEAMKPYLKDKGPLVVVGYEANGGFLTATTITVNGQNLTALPTRDAMIVPLTILMASITRKLSISALMQTLPQRFTSSGRIQNFPIELSAEHLTALQTGQEDVDKQAAQALFATLLGDIAKVDITDGVRMTGSSGEVLHLRPSGNAPELRCYTEASTQMRADEIKEQGLLLLAGWL